MKRLKSVSAGRCALLYWFEYDAVLLEHCDRWLKRRKPEATPIRIWNSVVLLIRESNHLSRVLFLAGGEILLHRDGKAVLLSLKPLGVESIDLGLKESEASRQGSEKRMGSPSYAPAHHVIAIAKTQLGGTCEMIEKFNLSRVN